MIAGQLLTVVADGDEIISRVLVSVENGVYFVCKREEYEAAKAQDREPVCIGFKKEYVVGLDQ
jgi:hypothetical protein